MRGDPPCTAAWRWPRWSSTLPADSGWTSVGCDLDEETRKSFRASKLKRPNEILSHVLAKKFYQSQCQGLVAFLQNMRARVWSQLFPTFSLLKRETILGRRCGTWVEHMPHYLEVMGSTPKGCWAFFYLQIDWTSRTYSSLFPTSYHLHRSVPNRQIHKTLTAIFTQKVPNRSPNKDT